MQFILRNAVILQFKSEVLNSIVNFSLIIFEAYEFFLANWIEQETKGKKIHINQIKADLVFYILIDSFYNTSYH